MISISTIYCGNHNLSHENPVDTLQQVEESPPKILVIKILESIDKKLLPAIVNQYFMDTNLVSIYVFDNRTIKFYSKQYNEQQTKVHLLDIESPKPTVCINSTSLDTSFCCNYFYFLQFNNNIWSNTSLQIIPSNAIEIIELEQESNICFKRITPKQSFYAFKGEDCLFGIDFNFQKGNCLISRLKYCDSINEINSTSFLELIFVNEKFEINKLINSINPNLLSDMELDSKRRYNLLSSAILDSVNVYILDLSSQEITTLSSEIGTLGRLQVLNLQNNELKTVPKEIGYLKHLQVIRLNSNQLVSLPKEIGSLDYLDELTLANNNIRLVPAGIYDFKNLKILNLSNNKITFLPVLIGELTSLVALDISNNYINTLPTEIKYLTNLRILNIENTLLNSKEIDRIQKLLPNTEIKF